MYNMYTVYCVCLYNSVLLSSPHPLTSLLLIHPQQRSRRPTKHYLEINWIDFKTKHSVSMLSLPATLSRSALSV